LFPLEAGCLFEAAAIDKAAALTFGIGDADYEFWKTVPGFDQVAVFTEGEFGDFELNTQLADFDKQTQNQVVVAIFKRKDSAATLADYCTGMFNKWGVGQKGKNNGVILFVFMDDHLLRISTGLGMDKILPDDECEQIIDRVMIGKMRKRQYDVAFSSAVDAILDAILIKQGPKTDGSSSGR